MKKIYGSLWGCLLLIFQGAAFSQSSVWMDTDETSISQPVGKRKIVPDHFRMLTLDIDGMKALLNTAPAEFTPAAPLVVSIPMPDGSASEFKVWSYSIMEPLLESQFPQIRTFLGQGITDPHAVIRMDYTQKGFHAYILSPSGTVSIDPYASNTDDFYISYYKRDLQNIHEFTCGYEDEGLPQDEGVKSLDPNGTTLRVYQLALACTGEYAVSVCSPNTATVAETFAEMTTAINRVNSVYERDMSARMVFVNNTQNLIFLNGGSDPYSNNDGGTMLGENQTVVTAAIGSANYDIGHVFSTGGGGIAQLAGLCNAGGKARGVTGLPNPTGDPFYIDYVSHEMGHQFNGSHTFNSNNGSCGGNRSGNNAYEPGSGSTIMAYGGICPPDNVVNLSDDYFHVRSFVTIRNHITGSANGCATSTATGNTPPTVEAGTGGNFVPISTPFKLTAVGTDTDGDAMTYCWEEYDLGSSISLSTTPNAGHGTPPLFRSYDPNVSPTRYFPQLSTVINNGTDTREKLPALTRKMTFRCTVRDNRVNGGGVSYDTVRYNFTAAAGPFLVTYPNIGGIAVGGSSDVTVTWDVAGTTASPVNCANVNILLSTDGGLTYPVTLLSNTPNDGSQLVTLPAVPSTVTTARIMVESAGNIFYDISNVNFTIFNTTGISEEPVSPVTAYPNPTTGKVSLAMPSEYALQSLLVMNTLGEVVMTEEKNISGNHELDLSQLAPGMYFVKLTGTDRKTQTIRIIRQ